MAKSSQLPVFAYSIRPFPKKINTSCIIGQFYDTNCKPHRKTGLFLPHAVKIRPFPLSRRETKTGTSSIKRKNGRKNEKAEPSGCAFSYVIGRKSIVVGGNRPSVFGHSIILSVKICNRFFTIGQFFDVNCQRGAQKGLKMPRIALFTLIPTEAARRRGCGCAGGARSAPRSPPG